MQKATFGAGCFWGVEDAFMKLPGVTTTAVGYTGGKTNNPTYREVCTDTTGHAEVVELEFDPKLITYRDLVQFFFKIHDPTTLNRQGPDYGSQYRSAIFYHNEQQKEEAEIIKNELNASGKLSRPIATQIVPASQFYKAEEYHQKYFQKQGGGHCHINF
jgi:peptide-methionine (S)-S-oxide reductase